MDKESTTRSLETHALHELDNPGDPALLSTSQTERPRQDGFDQAELDCLDEDVEEGVEGLDELDAPPPDENPDERRTEYHQNLEDERGIAQEMSEKSTKRVHLQQRLTVQLFIHSWLAFFSILGTLARLGVQWLTLYKNAPITTNVLWANFGGSLVLGFLQEDRALFAKERGRVLVSPSRSDLEYDEGSQRKHQEARETEAAAKKGIPLYIGLAVGFCGSFTSYSSFMRDMFLGLSNDLAGLGQRVAPRNAGWSVASVLGVMITEIAVSMSGLALGAHIAVALLPLLLRVPKMNSARVVNPLGVFLGICSWLGAIFLAVWPSHNVWRGEVVFALVFGPFGAILRYWLSIKLNRKTRSFPLGTFLANMLGTAILAISYDLQHVHLGSGIVGGNVLGCEILAGISDGFCGCLTTVSTWVAELRSLRKHHAYVYGFVSVGIGFSLMVVIVGTVRWTLGLSMPICQI